MQGATNYSEDRSARAGRRGDLSALTTAPSVEMRKTFCRTVFAVIVNKIDNVKESDYDYFYQKANTIISEWCE